MNTTQPVVGQKVHVWGEGYEDYITKIENELISVSYTKLMPAPYQIIGFSPIRLDEKGKEYIGDWLDGLPPVLKEPKLDPTHTDPDSVIKRLVEWIAEKDYVRGHKTGELLRDALTCIHRNTLSDKPKAPSGCVIDDNGSVIEGTWEHKNNGHGGFYWRFDSTTCTEED